MSEILNGIDSTKLRLGQMIFYKNIPSFLAWIQKIVTNTIYSHVSVAMGFIRVVDRQVEFDADLRVRLHSMRGRTKNMDVLEFVDVPYAYKELIIHRLIEGYDGKLYGFIQWLTVGLRFFFQWLGFKNAKSWDILWGWGVFCSELLYYYLIAVCVSMHSSGTDDWIDLYNELDTYNPNTFVPQDIVDLSYKYPKLFRWVE